VFVKICGVTTEGDAQYAARAGADAVGFVFWAASRRVVDPVAVSGFLGDLPSGLLTVAVFRDEAIERVLDIVRTTGVGGVQVHGSAEADVSRLRDRVPLLIEAVPADPGLHERAARSPADLLLVDAAQPGSGRTFDWSLLDGVPKERVLLAGGLTPGNVAEAIRRVGPFGVDVASGVEASAGHKDLGKVRSFVRAARGATEP
jgi:phosphoribosylanthranilate isomerase